MTRYYAHADGTASTTKPASTETDHTGYVYDPNNPVPTVGGSNLDMPCGPLDQAEIDQRADVLLFQTPVVDEAVFLTGPLFANLYVGSDAVDTDFMVRISDVYPTGEVRLIQDSAVRMRWREGGLTPVYMTPNTVYEVTASLWNTSYAIAPGHALRFAVTSSNYPRFSANPNNGELLIQNSTHSPINVANNILYHSEQYPSNFILPIVQKSQLPELHDIKRQFQKAYPQIDLDELMKSKLFFLYSLFYFFYRLCMTTMYYTTIVDVSCTTTNTTTNTLQSIQTSSTSWCRASAEPSSLPSKPPGYKISMLCMYEYY